MSEKSQKNNRVHPYLQLLLKYKLRLGLGFTAMLIAASLQLAFPAALAYFIDAIQRHAEQPIDPILAWVAVAALCVFTIAGACRFYLFDSAGNLMVSDMRRMVFNRMIHNDIHFFEQHNSAALSSRLSSDIDILKDTLTMHVAIFVRSLLVGIGALVLALQISVSLTLVVLLSIPASLFVAKLMGVRLRKAAMQLQASLANSTSTAQESFSGIRQIHAFNQQQLIADKYSHATGAVLSDANRNSLLSAVLQAASTLVGFLAMALVFAVGASMLISGKLSIGSLTSFFFYALMITFSANSLTGFLGSWQRAKGATEQVFAWLNANSGSTVQSASTDMLSVHKRRIEFKDVSFAYPSRPDKTVLHSISFGVEPGKTVALIGRSGSGKSTLFRLLLGFYAPTSGDILFGKTSITTIPATGLRARIGVVEQEPFLFSGSIFDNIAFALPVEKVKKENVYEAARLAQAESFILNLPQGYETTVGENGTQLSGGQKQRIAIARAILRDPEILLLDEATSAVDKESEKLIQVAMRNLTHDRTCIVIAHTLSTVAHADRVLVLQEGRLVESGSHQQLSRLPDSQYRLLMESGSGAA